MTKYAVYLTAFLLAAAAAPSVPAAAGLRTTVAAAAEETPQIIADGTINADVTWQLDDAGTLTVTGSGDMSEMTGGFSRYKSMIKKAVIRSTDEAHPLTAIGAGLFQGCSAMTEVTIPDTIAVIGESAFSSTALTELTLPGCALSWNSFYRCTALKTVVIGEGTEHIPGQCFRDCVSLESVYLPDSVKSVDCGSYNDHGAFFNCKSLKTVSIGKCIETVDCRAFDTNSAALEITFREGVTAVPANAFDGRTELTKVVLPDTLQTIGNAAFRGCSNLSVCNFPSGLTAIGENAFSSTALTELTLPGCALSWNSFYHCTELKTVVIGEGTEHIPGQCFRDCISLESVILPDSVKSINCGSYNDHGAFFNCKSLKTVSIGTGIETIDHRAFDTNSAALEVTFREGVTAVPVNAFRDRSEVTKVVLPSTLQTVGSFAFCGCTNLSECNFPDALREIGESAFNSAALTELTLPGCALSWNSFYNCTALRSVVIGEGTESIPGQCFRDCISLESVILPDSVKSINCGSYNDHGAFFNCKSLKTVSIGKCIETIDHRAFDTNSAALEVTFREGVTAVPANAFNGRSEVTKVVLPSTLRTIGDSAFCACTNLSECNFPAGLTAIGQNAFNSTALTELTLSGCALSWNSFYNCTALKTVVIGDGTESIPGQCFRDCISLESVVLPDSVKSINCGNYNDHGAFFNCKSLKTVSIGKCIETIDSRAFDTNSAAMEVTFREGVTAVPANAFNGRSEVTKVVLPSTLQTVSDFAFNGCSNLSVCNFPAGLTAIGESAFSSTALTELTLPGCALSWSSFYHCTALKTVVIGEGTEHIPGQCFRDCVSLESVYLPDSVKSVDCGSYNDQGAFFNCKSMETVSIGTGIETVDGRAFSTNSETLAVTFRDGVTAIPEHAFDRSNVTAIILPDTVKEIGADTIARYTGLQLVSILAPDCNIADSAAAIPSSARIRGAAGSTAQQYAEKYGRNFVTFEEDLIAYGNCVTGLSLTLNGRIGINFYAKLNSKAVKAVLTGAGKTVEYSGSALADARLPDGTYKFTFGVNAAQAGEIITLKLLDENGRQLDIYNSELQKSADKAIGYSVNDYIAETAKYYDDADLKAMVAALDQYCKAAENYFCHKNHQLNIPDANITKTNDFNHQFRISLVLDSGTALRIYSDARLDAVRFYDGDKIPLVPVVLDGGTQYYEISDISAFHLLDNEIIRLDGVKYTVCPMDYCALALAKDESDPKLKDVCRALYYYGAAAKAYGSRQEA